jgi:signal transduction histidine kinase
VATEYRELIFRKFESVKLPGASRARGSGLGLAFCRLVVEAHGGHVWVQGPPSDGTPAGAGPAGAAFHVQLPLVPVAR